MQTLNYAIDEKVVIKNLAMHNKCQRCGKDSLLTLCPSCSTSGNATIGAPVVNVPLANMMFKRATFNGCDVFVNGVKNTTMQSAFAAEMMAASLNKSFGKHNSMVAAAMPRSH